MNIDELNSYFQFEGKKIIEFRRFIDFSHDLCQQMSPSHLKHVIEQSGVDLESFDGEDDGLNLLSSCALFRELYLADEDSIRAHHWIANHLTGDFLYYLQKSWAISSFSVLIDLIIQIAQEAINKEEKDNEIV